MAATCSWISARKHLRGARRPGGGRHPREDPDVDAVILQVSRGGPMTVPELRRAAAVLDRHVGSRRMDVLAARLRVAIRLEDLGA